MRKRLSIGVVLAVWLVGCASLPPAAPSSTIVRHVAYAEAAVNIARLAQEAEIRQYREGQITRETHRQLQTGFLAFFRQMDVSLGYAVDDTLAIEAREAAAQRLPALVDGLVAVLTVSPELDPLRAALDAVEPPESPR